MMPTKTTKSKELISRNTLRHRIRTVSKIIEDRKVHRYAFRITIEQQQKIDDMCEKYNITKSELMNLALNSYIEQLEQEDAKPIPEIHLIKPTH